MKHVKKVWIIGGTGRIGKALCEVIDCREVEILSTDEEDVDITDGENVISYGERNRPDIIINCASITDFEECERDVKKAYRVNAIGARNVALLAERIGAKLVHVSTDDVFCGTNDKPYSEFDIPTPTTVYGKSKFAGEQFVRDFAQHFFIVRSNWVYGFGESYISQVVDIAKDHDKIKVSNETVGSPTSAVDLAEFIVALMQTSEYGIYHVTSQGTCNRYEFACEIVKLLGLNVEVVPVKNEEDEISANRPAYAILDNVMLSLIDDYQMPEWKTALRTYIEKHTK